MLLEIMKQKTEGHDLILQLKLASKIPFRWEVNNLPMITILSWDTSLSDPRSVRDYNNHIYMN